MNIYVGNLSWSMTDEDLTNLFTQYGTVTSGKILKDKMNGRSKGFGFVEMEDDEAARTAIANLNETEVQGRKLIERITTTSGRRIQEASKWRWWLRRKSWRWRRKS